MAKILQLSEAASLALHSMVLIAKSENHINVNKLAEKMGVSRNHLAKVLQQLVKYNFLKSVRGPSGGFMLNKPASQISILDIYEAIEGEIYSPECPLDKSVCPFEKCIMGTLVKDMTSQFKKHFQNNSLKDFLELL